MVRTATELPIASTSKIGTKPMSVRSAMNKYSNRSNYKLGTSEEYQFAMTVLREYINTFGSVLLRSQSVLPTISTRVKKDEILAWDVYEMSSIAPWLKGFKHFFLEYKVNAPPEAKKQWTRIVSDFIGWCVERELLSVKQLLDYEVPDTKTILAAAFAQTNLRNVLAHKNNNVGRLEDWHDAEPLYMVSRVRAGKLWFITCIASGPSGYEEFGPVPVPKGVTDVVQPGWAIEASFGKRGGTWQMMTAGKVIAI